MILLIQYNFQVLMEMYLLSNFDCIPVCELYLKEYFIHNQKEANFMKSH